MRKFTLLVLLASLLTALIACVPVESENPTALPESIEPSIPSTESPLPSPTGTTDLNDDSSPGLELERGEVPQEFFDAVLADLITNHEVQRDSIEIIKSEEIIWSDGSLGCPEADVMYTQAPVDGYQVIFGSGNETYDYHLSDSGYFVLCEFSRPLINPQGTPEK